ncbi:septum site-determining protein MinC [Oricola thermophila]|uniref:Probable septum site-determining protein MinC n=1 Tax=Oricola thermophila TaxID=2742145 RepID=A0A6N1V945_9HYPH|nr:septum site-determining protein MinC [Oricola thermophila]QKV17476.1 septum site-determining protein MinC [Oricola thermophila]
MTEVLTATQPIRLKGRSFLALVLSPELPFSDWLARLDDLAARSAGFFLQRPIVLNVEGLEIDRPQLRDLVGELGQRQVRVMGIEGARSSLLGYDMPPAMRGGRPATGIEVTDAQTPIIDHVESEVPANKAEPAPPPAPSTLITEPVRSGQSLVCDGDITIVGSVASGAEVIAGGSIHVYGTLRGRAAAGSMGNTSARIFCRKLEAELIAICGYYKTSEDIDPGLRSKGVQFWLEGDAILAETLS